MSTGPYPIVHDVTFNCDVWCVCTYVGIWMLCDVCVCRCGVWVLCGVYVGVGIGVVWCVCCCGYGCFVVCV